ncbi:pilin [Psychrobacter sp. ANT_H59]|uniref:pilin n=1 Tax=Psychrobacter sp. ANT_H59 TaxID=2597354 RepID=UPI0011EF1C5B|nr:pilin [Psychrobacter sp. ANT_H59]KAA0938907.1 prepilin-type N-terminal cleavage/methylation domain-containing protein [Psychrobacter sp. ANT_H59]
MQPSSKLPHKNQSGFTLIEIMMVIAIIGILAAIVTASYQNYIRQTQVMLIYQEINHFRMPYQILIDEGAGVTEFSPSGLNMPAQTQYCQFSVTPPNANAATPNAVQCQIQNLSYLSNQTLTLDRNNDSNWTCRASVGIATAYLPQACR